jgi:hypothetical protein
MIPKLLRGISDEIQVIVSNRVDILPYVALKTSGFPAQRVTGSGPLGRQSVLDLRWEKKLEWTPETSMSTSSESMATAVAHPFKAKSVIFWGRRNNMSARPLITVTAFILVIGSSPALAQERTSGELRHREGVMMRSAMMGPEFLHDHMNSMIRQMSIMVSIMSQMMESDKMDAETVKLMSEIIREMSTMMHEMPAVRKMMEERPDMAMKDMGKMMKTMSELMDKMAGMMARVRE